MINKALFWIPRAIAILAMLVFMAFSFDCFGGGQPLGKMLICFLMSNIPTIIMILILVFLWKNDLLLGILFGCAAIYFAVRFDGFGRNTSVLIIAAPFLLAGLFFFMRYYFNQKQDKIKSE